MLKIGTGATFVFCRHLKPLENQFSTWNHDIKEAILIFHRHGRFTVYITLFPLFRCFKRPEGGSNK